MRRCVKCGDPRWHVITVSIINTGVQRRLIASACICLVFSGLIACNGMTPRRSGANAVDGTIDLRGRDLSQRISLDGEWLFYPEVFVEPAEVESPPVEPVPIDVPALWNGQMISGERFGAHGSGTYRLDILLDRRGEPLYLRVREISTAFRLYVDGKLILRGGEPGHARRTTTPQWVTTARRFIPERERLTLLVHVSNFHHARGGIRDEILISSSPGMLRALQGRRNIAWFVFGALLVMGIYHLMLMHVRIGNRSTLWFGLVSLMMAIRTVLTGQPALLSASTVIGWEFLLSLEYVSMYIGFAMFYLYVNALFPEEMHRLPLTVVKTVGIVLGITTIVTPAHIFSATLYGFHFVSVFGCLYLLYVVYRAFRAGRDGTVFFAIGMAILAATILNDVLYNIGILRTEYLSSVGLLLFLVFQSLILASRFGANVRRIEELLVESNRFETLTYRDGLTGIGNRRHFDATLDKEWARARRHGQPLSVVIVDIDAFKRYNDNYGHLKGDTVLIQVAHCLRDYLHRSSDFVARYGGEEFAVILPSTDRAGALAIAETMREAIERLAIEHAYSHVISVLTASFGVATAVPRGDTGSRVLVEEADRALYRAKQNCKNCVF